MTRYILGFLWLALITAPVFAQQVVDQVNPDNDITDATGVLIKAGTVTGQVITAGVSGQLTRIDLSLVKLAGTTHPLIVDIMPTAGDEPVFDEASRLARQVVPAAAVPNHPGFPPPTLNVAVSFSGLTFAAGDRYAVVLRSDQPDPYDYEWYSNRFNSYDGGSRYSLIGDRLVRSIADSQFRTYMTLIPEPSTGALALISILGMAAFRLTNHRHLQHRRNM